MSTTAPETWKAVARNADYEVSDLGRVASLKGGKRKILNLRTAAGYRLIDLWGQGGRETVRVHVLVLEAFVGPCPAGMECLHGPDHERSNNRLDNLRWGTRRENVIDRVVQGRTPPRRRNIAPATIAEMTRMKDGGHRVVDIARRFGVSASGVVNAIKRKVRGVPGAPT